MKKLAFLLPIWGLMLTGCAQSADESAAAADSTPPVVTVAPGNPLPDLPLARLWQTHRPVIYEGTMQLLVPTFDRATRRLDSLLYRHGAYLAQSEESSQDGQRRQELVLRVPSDQFVPLTYALGSLGRVDHKSITSRDLVTEKLQIRISPTVTTDSVQAAQDRLLAREATMGTLRLTYYQLTPLAMEPDLPLADRLRAGLVFGWQLAGKLLVVLCYFWPFTLLLLGWLLYRWLGTGQLRASR